MKTQDKYLNEGVISSKDPNVFRNITHANIKKAYDQVKWMVNGGALDDKDVKKWKEVMKFLDKALAKIITI